ncbi:MAG: hypothetical protein IPJ32_13975 [Sphingobacteriaceae bacterium]|nr:hypothetical protein [Sphingobacteriaceae bacterium]
MELVITSYCRIKDKSIFVNGSELLIPKHESSFFGDVYKHLEINYPKFHKMDNLSKLGLIATEAALKGNDFLKRNSAGKHGAYYGQQGFEFGYRPPASK